MRLKFKRGTGAQAAASAEVPHEGEPVWLTDEKALLIGDGVSRVNQLRANDLAIRPTGTSRLAPAQDLNTVTTPGDYFQNPSAGTTVALNYPLDGFAGLVRVTASGSMLVQEATYFLSNSVNVGRWFRTQYNGTWGGWAKIGPDTSASVTAAGTDANNIVEPGRYLLSASAANTPVALTGHLEVLDRQVGDTPLQRFTMLETGGGRGGQWTRNRTSSGVWRAWVQTADIGGSGSPEGAISAPLGTYYIDTVATNGARRWRNTSPGTTNTGWVVTDGDTGERDVTSLLTADWKASTSAPVCLLRRIGNVVYMQVRIGPADSIIGTNRATTRVLFDAIPTGFAPATYTVSTPAYVAGVSRTADTTIDNQSALARLNFNGGGLTGTWGTGDVVFAAQTSWLTRQAWPTTLPGTPA